MAAAVAVGVGAAVAVAVGADASRRHTAPTALSVLVRALTDWGHLVTGLASRLVRDWRAAHLHPTSRPR
ncbi:hypothetical protein ACFVZN_03865 [Streptomyces virginiae]|uniref:hypothetical protein n=1 Tax=Streptomyces virginiae TaxID=1961 RepID=UPI0036BBF1AE